MTRYFAAVDDAASLTRTLTENLDGMLFDTSLTLFRALHQIALEVAEASGYSPRVSEVEFFCPVEAVALALGRHRVTIYRALLELRSLGLVDSRPHYTTLNGRTRVDGSLFAVRLRPLEGRAARLSYGALRRQYRSLSADIREGRTVFALAQRSKENPSRQVNLEYMRRFAVTPLHNSNPVLVSSDRCASPRSSLEALLDLTGAARGDRRGAVDTAAQALAAALRDSRSLNFYRSLLHRLLRRYDATGQDSSYALYLAAQRAAVDDREGFARRAGALLVSRLKDSGLFDELSNAPPPAYLSG